MNRARACRFAVACVLAGGCSAEGPPAQRTELEGEQVARVDDEVVTRDVVASIARAQDVTPREALDRATFDALVAREARARGVDARLRRRLNGALAQVLVDDLAKAARAEGPPTDEEVADLTARRWMEVARPEAVVLVHAVVLVPPDADAATSERALATAKKIRTAVEASVALARETAAPDNMPKRGLPPPADPVRDDFVRRAKAVAPDDPGVIAEPLWPIGSDGRAVKHDGREPYDPAFVKSGFELRNRGDLTEPVRSSFGYHVILLLDRLPGAMLSADERRKLFERDVVYERTGRRIEALLGELRTSTRVEDKDPSVEGLLQQVVVAP
ncbi:MAG: hypothetical protein HOW73_49950 [Polyangiaceae bacterium]|nr:hypothetical protein [Polyangiaceae bacterium]